MNLYVCEDNDVIINPNEKETLVFQEFPLIIGCYEVMQKLILAFQDADRQHNHKA